MMMQSYFSSTGRKRFYIKGILTSACMIGIAAFTLNPILLYTCHHRIACIAQHSRWLRTRLDNAVPLFLTETPKTQEKDGVIQRAWPLLAHYVADFRARLAHTAEPVQCAVVGASSTLLGSGYGALIDRHDYVFRMNSPPLDHYEHDVGKKITFNVEASNRENIVKNYGKDTWTIIWGNGSEAAMANQLLGNPPDDKHQRIQLAANDMPVVVLSKAFDDYVMHNWFTPTKHLQKDEWPSTGFRVIILAFHLCDTVDLFGFGPDAQGKFFRYYAKKGEWVGHRMDYQEEFIDTLVKQDIVRRYMGNIHADEK